MVGHDNVHDGNVFEEQKVVELYAGQAHWGKDKLTERSQIVRRWGNEKKDCSERQKVEMPEWTGDGGKSAVFGTMMICIYC